MAKKVLILASVASMIDQFNMPNIKLLIEMGYKVHVACNFEEGNTCSDEKIERLKDSFKKMCVDYYQIDFKRNVMKMVDNLNAYMQVLKLMKDNEYNFVHCHSPIGGVCGRLAGKATSTKVIYTAHGFHFYKGAPLKNWLIYYPIERLLARYTDVLITINREDYKRAKKSFKAGEIEYIPGVGIDTEKFRKVNIEKSIKRSELGIPDGAFVVLSVGELNENKNHETVIKAIAKLNNAVIHYVIAGQGGLEDYLVEKTNELGLQKQVHLLGFRKDIPEIYKVSDIFVFPSFREGLSVALMEAMASGLPVVCSDIRGNVDLIKERKGGFLVKPDDVEGYVDSLDKLIQNITFKESMSVYNKKNIREFDLENVKQDIKKIYLGV